MCGQNKEYTGCEVCVRIPHFFYSTERVLGQEKGKSFNRNFLELTLKNQ
jgi:hypothetical protein